MKDDKYQKLLEEVTNRVMSSWSWNDLQNLDKKMDDNIEIEMKNAKKILLSSGHDLEDVKDFYEEVNKNVSELISGFSI